MSIDTVLPNLPKLNPDKLSRNIRPQFDCWTNTEIKEHCAATSCGAAMAMMHINGDFNISTMLRNANFFGFAEVYYIGRKNWDRRGAVGCQNYTPIQHVEDFSEFYTHITQLGYKLIGIENNVPNGGIPNLWGEILKVRNALVVDFPSKPLFLFGEENDGLSPEILKFCHMIVEIPAFGSVRSLNVATASGILAAMYRQQTEAESVTGGDYYKRTSDYQRY